MSNSILVSTKKALSLPEDYDVFDDQVIMHINSVFSDLAQMGIGPDEGFEITNDTATWDHFLGLNKRLNMVKSYMYLRVRKLFDPPGTSFHLTAIDEQKKEMEWRMTVAREGWTYIPVTTTLDGGTATG